MICVLLLAAGEAWESPALADLEEHPGVVVLKRCVDVDDLLASVTSGQADVEIVVHGREVDVDGTRDLIQRVGDGMRAAGAV